MRGDPVAILRIRRPLASGVRGETDSTFIARSVVAAIVVDGERGVALALLVVAVLVLVGAVLEDPLGLGSTGVYTLTAMGI